MVNKNSSNRNTVPIIFVTVIATNLARKRYQECYFLELRNYLLVAQNLKMTLKKANI